MKPPGAAPNAKLTGIILLFLWASAPAFPQQIISAKAGNIQFLQGEVRLNGTPLKLNEGHPVQMENNQLLNTGKGYAELLLAPDAYLRLDEYSSLRMRQNSLADIELALNRGSALIEILKKLKTDPIRVVIADSVIEMKKEGLYRLDAGPPGIRVYGGDALAIKGKKKARIKNERTVALDGKLKTEKFDAHEADPLHRWAAERSLALHARNLFFTKPFNFRESIWRSRPEGIYNPHYRLTLAANEDWNRYWQGLWNRSIRRFGKRVRQLRTDPGPLPVPPPIIAVQPAEEN